MIQTKLKAFADNIPVLNVTKTIISVFDRVENIAGKGEIASKGVIVWEWVNDPEKKVF